MNGHSCHCRRSNTQILNGGEGPCCWAEGAILRQRKLSITAASGGLIYTAIRLAYKRIPMYAGEIPRQKEHTALGLGCDQSKASHRLFKALDARVVGHDRLRNPYFKHSMSFGHLNSRGWRMWPRTSRITAASCCRHADPGMHRGFTCKL